MNTSSLDLGGLGEFMAGITSHLQEVVKQNNITPKGFIESWQAFFAAIDFTKDRWISYLMAFHLLQLVVFIMTRSNVDIQTVQFLIICMLVMISERLNGYCAIHWQEFSTQNYFDEHGVFTCIIFSAPLLVIGFMQLINFLLIASDALITAKRMELKINRAKQAKEEGVMNNSGEQNEGEKTTGKKSTKNKKKKE